MWDHIRVTTAPQSLAEDLLTEAKKNVEETSADHDDFIRRLINAAVGRLDGPNGAGLALRTQTWTLTLDCFPPWDIILPGWPVQSVTSVQYIDTDGNPQVLASSEYSLKAGSDPVRLVPEYDKYWPSVRNVEEAVTIAYVLGNGSREDIDEPLIDAILLYVAHRFNNREAISLGTMQETPLGFSDILADYRRGLFGA